MGKTSKWIRNLLTGRKDRDREKEKITTRNVESTPSNSTPPITIPQAVPAEKRRWSFRRSSAAGPGQKMEAVAAMPPSKQGTLGTEDEQSKHALAVAAATAAAADAAVAAAQAAAAVIRLTVASATGRASAVEEAAAVKIQSVFRSYLARKALNALRGLVQLQALVRGHLVRKQATATLRCMQALVTVQARARAERIRMAESGKPVNHKPFNYRNSSAIHDNNMFRHQTYNDFDGAMEENIKIVEMDLGESKGPTTKNRNSYSSPTQSQSQAQTEPRRFSTHSAPNPKQDYQSPAQISPSPSAITDISPRTCSGHFEDYSFTTAQNSPHYYSAVSKHGPSKALPFAYNLPEYAQSLSYEYPFYPNYMANTESSRAKARSQSVPKARPDSFERQPSVKRRPSIEGRNVPRAVRMQRSSSHVGSTAQNYQYPWSVKLDRSSVSLKDSECGSTSTVLTNTNYCRSLVGFDVSGRI